MSAAEPFPAAKLAKPASPPMDCRLTAARSVLHTGSVPVGVSVDARPGAPAVIAVALGDGRFERAPVRMQVDQALPIERTPVSPTLTSFSGDDAGWLLGGMRDGETLALLFTLAGSGQRVAVTIPLAGFADALDAARAHYAAAEGVQLPPPRLTRPGPPQTP